MCIYVYNSTTFEYLRVHWAYGLRGCAPVGLERSSLWPLCAVVGMEAMNMNMDMSIIQRMKRLCASGYIEYAEIERVQQDKRSMENCGIVLD